MVYTCRKCGREFEDKPSHRRIYCSKACHDAAMTTSIELKCDWCGKKHKVPPCNIKAWRHHFCYQECRLKWFSKYTTEELNAPGHSAGHKAPHLTALNTERNAKIAIQPDKATRGEYKNKEHRAIAEKMLGRKLLPTEDVHHINGIHGDNRPENLMVLDHLEHLRLHWKLARERGVI